MMSWWVDKVGSNTPASRRRGVTLIELLVVITILLLLLAVMIPRLRPMMEQRRMREAARTVSV
ncbi:MAG: prepilin-type N-terminal cleavage/methylation domain-containing protein, partial [Thermogutta sp.]